MDSLLYRTDKTEEWDVIDKLSEDVEKTAREIPSTYELKQKYKGYTETSEKSKEKLLEISST
ncbi:unnamed protein product [Caenorhabditis auriculariae]|uniref:Uncharacterized protein n=1 Tax=Caenorhabditis auriculariae TaxID=2777116 RepID=A0A8S1HWX1_9PELO|nr:unnamed protein product [Caenorhabditis auriculariae]